MSGGSHKQIGKPATHSKQCEYFIWFLVDISRYFQIARTEKCIHDDLFGPIALFFFFSNCLIWNNKFYVF